MNMLTKKEMYCFIIDFISNKIQVSHVGRLLTWIESEQNIFPHSFLTTEVEPVERKQ